VLLWPADLRLRSFVCVQADALFVAGCAIHCCLAGLLAVRAPAVAFTMFLLCFLGSEESGASVHSGHPLHCHESYTLLVAVAA
jgi:hypothetical protein